MTPLDTKLISSFPGLVVRKDLTKSVKGNAVVPTYVLEYLLGQYCATDDEATIESGVSRVRDILAKHYVHRNEAGKVRADVKERGSYKVIDRILIELNDKKDCYEATFSNLGLKAIPTSSEHSKKHPKLLVGGVWCIVDISYMATDDPKGSPWAIDSLKPIQVSNFDMEQYLSARNEFTTEEWMGVLLQTMGFNPEMFNRRSMMLQLVRMVSFCERNYNMIELGPKGTGKSHIFSEFSPHGILISGGEVTMAKLFVNNSSGKIGLVGYWDTICFDEFAGKDKKVDKSLVDIMKNYMANKTFSRGIEALGAEASMVFMGNTKKSAAYMMKHSHFFEQLPDKYIDSAFLDRIHSFNPGWEVAPISNDLFSNGYGLIVDYLAEAFKNLRNEDFAHLYQDKYELSPDITTRDRDGVHKTFAGLMKLIHPTGECTEAETKELLMFAMEGRKRVKDNIMRLDDTFPETRFYIKSLSDGDIHPVKTLEETQHPDLAKIKSADENKGLASQPLDNKKDDAGETAEQKNEIVGPEKLESGKHVIVPENIKGVTYEQLFADHLQGSRNIVVRDPYIRMNYQIKNFLELLHLINNLTPDGEEVHVHLVTQSDLDYAEKQDAILNELITSTENSKIVLTFAYENSNSFHARSVQSDNGWKIFLDRGLDIFQRFDQGMFSLASMSQEERLTKGCEITYLQTIDEK